MIRVKKSFHIHLISETRTTIPGDKLYPRERHVQGQTLINELRHGLVADRRHQRSHLRDRRDQRPSTIFDICLDP